MKYFLLVISISSCTVMRLEAAKPQCDSAMNYQETSSMLQLRHQNVSGLHGVASTASIDKPIPPEVPPCCRAEVYQHKEFGIERGVRWIANLRPGRYTLDDFKKCG